MSLKSQNLIFTTVTDRSGKLPNLTEASSCRNNEICTIYLTGGKVEAMKKIAIGCDPNAVALKEAIKKHLTDLGYEWEDYGSDDPVYANVAIRVAESVAAGKHERGILMCGTGIGMCLAANKVPEAYAALCSDPYSTERSVKSNNANIMTLGAQVMGVELAKTLVTIWMKSEYTPGGRSESKIRRIYEYAKEHQK
jgi:ribose 5-phosphate isomerase B